MTTENDGTEAGGKVEMTMQELVARQAVLEAVQTQLMVKVARTQRLPAEFVRAVMQDAEENLRRARDKAPEKERATASVAFSCFLNYSMRLIDGMTKSAKRQ